MIDLLGMVVFGTIVGIGVLDGKSGLGLWDAYRSAGVTGRGRPSATSRDEGNQPIPPAPAQ